MDAVVGFDEGVAQVVDGEAGQVGQGFVGVKVQVVGVTGEEMGEGNKEL
jgi:acyl-CoA reductase-like NAD-dependent aldehyde dehydrogenase